MSEQVPLAIVGISCLFPKADDLQAYWNNIKNGVDAITPLPDNSHWKSDDFFDANPKAPDRTYARRGGFISPVNFNPMEYGIAPKDIEATDTTQLLGMVAAKQALADAGYDKKPFNRQRTSVLLGVTGALELVIPLGARLGHPIWRRALKEAGVDDSTAEDVVQRIADGYVPWQENSFPGLLGNVAAGRIASRLDLGGTNCVVDAACASSFGAIHLAALELESGRSDMVITGGVDTFNDIFMYMCFSKTPALSPTGDSKPFDRDCDGTILGEGIGMLVFKRLADAERDGDKIYAVLKGIGSSSDGRGGAIYEPRSEGQIEAVKRAYEGAGISADTVDLIEAHGTGTKVGDATELRSITKVFRDAKPEGTWAALGSVKSQIGHTKAAAGVAGLIKAALALEHKVLPPTIKVKQPLDEAASGKSPFYVNTQKRPWLPRNAHPRRAGVSAFGFGGTNFHCVLEEHGAQAAKVDWSGDVELLALCADDLRALRRELTTLPDSLSWSELRTRAHASRKSFRREAKFRLVLPLSKDATQTRTSNSLAPTGGEGRGEGALRALDIATLRDSALSMLDKQPDKTSWTLPTGVAFGSGARTGKLGALFPGQGSQYPGMFRDLACQFPEVLEAIAGADRIFAAQHPEAGLQRLSDYIYPHPAFSDETKRDQETALKATEIAQPAIGAVSMGALALAKSFGIQPEAAAGHSYGELSALCCAERISPESLHTLSNVRGQLMASRNGHSDRGSMIAVQAAEEVVTDVLKAADSGLVIANRNSPTQFVLAGSRQGVEKVAAECQKRSVRARVLQVSAAFHSELVSDACEPFAKALENIKFAKGEMPVFANTTAAVYPAAAKTSRELLAKQIINPVNFTAEIEAMHAAGVTTFLELGPGRVLSDLVQAILPQGSVETIAIDASRGSRSGTFDLAVALGRLAALGHEVDLTKWEEAPATVSTNGKPAFTVPVGGANVRTSKPAPRPARPTPAPTVARAPVVTAPSISAPAPRVQPAHAVPVNPSSHPAPLSPELAAALQSAQQGMLALQKLQEQTAQLHRQFLEGQESARRTLEALMGQRREILGLAPIPQTATPAPAPVPMPVVVQTLPATQSAPQPGRDALPRVLPAEQKAPTAPQVADGRPGGRPYQASSPKPPESKAVDEVSKAVLNVVSEKTGYPVEMLNLEMGLDTDLGIDSIKRVEIMAALRGRLPQAPEIKPEHLGTLQTLQQVVDFLNAGTEAAPEAASTPAKVAAAPSSGVDTSRASQALLKVVSDKTGYPVEMLNLEMGLDTDLGIDSIKRVEIMAAIRGELPDAPEIKPEHLGTLQTLQQVVNFLTAGSKHASAPVAAKTKPAAQVASGLNSQAASKALLKVVSEKTGYPVEMLNLNMGLDSDLGIDSIKRVEIMAAIRGELPDAPEIKPEHLGTLQTLQQVVDFLTAGQATETVESFVAVGTGAAQAGVDSAEASRALLKVVSEKTGYPVEMLNLDMGLDSDLGIDSIKRVEIMAAIRGELPDAPEIKPEHLGTLQTLQQVVDFLASGSGAPEPPLTPALSPEGGEGVQSDASEATLDRQVVRPAKIAGDRESLSLKRGSEVWITDDGSTLVNDIASLLSERGYSVNAAAPEVLLAADSAEPAAVILLWPESKGGDVFLKRAFRVVQAAASSLKAQNGILISVSRLDGVFGFGNLNGRCEPMSGGLAGLVKTARHEWPGVHCKAIDISPEVPASRETAQLIVEEMFSAGPVEVGLAGGSSFAMNIQTEPFASSPSTAKLQPGDVVVVTGGARGITATTALELARDCQPHFAMIGRSQLAESEPSWLTGLSAAADIKRALLAHAEGDRSPKAIEKRYREVMAQREINEHLRLIREAGSEVAYYSADVRNESQVGAVLNEVRAKLGPIRGLIHGAGVLADKLIEDKTEEQFDLVYSTKVDGLKNLLAAVAGDDLKVLALFSSYTGRFGRTGQVDYAIANEVLNKMAQVESRRRPNCRVVSFNWGPWNGGMVSDGLRKIFESEGVGLIEPDAGARFFVREVTSASPDVVEVLALAQVGSRNGTDESKSEASPVQSASHESAGSFHTAFERDINARTAPCLESHVLNGKAVVPAALMIEWLAHAAMHGNPGMKFQGLEGFKVLKGIVLEPDGSQRVVAEAAAGQLNDAGSLSVPVRIVSQLGGRQVVHARAEVLLGETSPSRPEPAFDAEPGMDASSDVYGDGRLFHGIHFQGIESYEGSTTTCAAAAVKSAPAPKQWLAQPLRPSWIADPLALDASFQLMILWSCAQREAPSLPCAIESYRQFAHFPKDGCRIVARVTPGTSPVTRADLLFLDRKGRVIASAEGYECVIDPGLRDAFRLNRLALEA